MEKQSVWVVKWVQILSDGERDEDCATEETIIGVFSDENAALSFGWLYKKDARLAYTIYAGNVSRNVLTLNFKPFQWSNNIG